MHDWEHLMSNTSYTYNHTFVPFKLKFFLNKSRLVHIQTLDTFAVVPVVEKGHLVLDQAELEVKSSDWEHWQVVPAACK